MAVDGKDRWPARCWVSGEAAHPQHNSAIEFWRADGVSWVPARPIASTSSNSPTTLLWMRHASDQKRMGPRN